MRCAPARSARLSHQYGQRSLLHDGTLPAHVGPVRTIRRRLNTQHQIVQHKGFVAELLDHGVRLARRSSRWLSASSISGRAYLERRKLTKALDEVELRERSAIAKSPATCW